MSVDRLLTTTLRAYQEPQVSPQTDRLYSTTVTLLTNLNNPLNVSLLTSHLLTARAIWESPDTLRTCLRIISIFNTAAIHVLRNELDNAKLSWGQTPVGSGVGRDKWARAVAKGADERSPRWKHLLALTGILMGMENKDLEERTSMSWGLRSTVERAVVTAANLALENPSQAQETGSNAVVLALSYAFPILSASAKRSINGNLILPAVMAAMTGAEGFQLIEGDFLTTISAGNVAGHEAFYHDSPASFVQVQRLESRPLVQNMGPVSRLAVFAVQHAADSMVVLQAQDTLLALSANLLERWRLSPFSSIDMSTEAVIMSPEMLQGPWAMLWQLLKKIMYTVVATAQPIVGRCLVDSRLRSDVWSPVIATKTLDVLRNLYFISSRQGAETLQVYTFTYLTSIDILARYPEVCISFLQKTQPPPQAANSLPPTPFDQALTLFYLNTAEHLPLSLPTAEAEKLIVAPATAHLSSVSQSPPPSAPTSLALPLFESSHSAILSVLSCPQHSDLTIAIIPFYIDTLLSSFPTRISPHQFRLAFKTIIQIVSPPFPIAATHPHLSETLLEMLHFRAASASATALPPDSSPLQADSALSTKKQPQAPISEQSTLVLALIDALPFLPLHIVEEWLTRTAEAMNSMIDSAIRETAWKRFWDVLVNGEMDVERAAVGVAWWGIGGGREMVLSNAPKPSGVQFLMSGALGSQLESSRL
ncbi:uncharacterized protein BCR38DRAFT_419914 [Pseudomassariella vexata]|uniref:Peroxin 8 n=1 Tax=Pseudomassariella vexata TaxID=1141098 RepID=A0A1Y2EEA0_9PEZI|nr:uncharacterized protein BCR38DRAFT_419914 [Pseudomassariella vexata]ORY69727.1 hypothetical protein BCR38DRAFT_419914 [Pseudomassariella vexata]